LILSVASAYWRRPNAERCGVRRAKECRHRVIRYWPSRRPVSPLFPAHPETPEAVTRRQDPRNCLSSAARRSSRQGKALTCIDVSCWARLSRNIQIGLGGRFPDCRNLHEDSNLHRVLTVNVQYKWTEMDERESHMIPNTKAALCETKR
jgi:hypothetical protein